MTKKRAKKTPQFSLKHIDVLQRHVNNKGHCVITAQIDSKEGLRQLLAALEPLVK